MKIIVLVLFSFTVVGLLRERLGRTTYAAMLLIIVLYVVYAYHAAGAS